LNNQKALFFGNEQISPVLSGIFAKILQKLWSLFGVIFWLANQSVKGVTGCAEQREAHLSRLGAPPDVGTS